MDGWDEKYAGRASRMRASEIRELLKLLDQPDIISFAGGIPDPALFPAEAFRDAYTAALADGQAGYALQYSVSEGYAPLREWIAERMAAVGVPVGIDNIVITSGSQQALDYLGKLFLLPGDTALVARPTYLGALQAFNAYEPNYEALALAETNVTPEALKAAAAKAGGRIGFAYVNPEFANPTGETLDLAQREKLLDLAEELDIPVIEDSAYQGLRYDGVAVPPLLALDIARKGGIEATRTLYCGTFSKTLAPGLRLGWVVAASPVIRKLVLMKQAADLHTPTINQVAMYNAARACFDGQLAKLQEVYRGRRDNVLKALGTHMPRGVTWTKPEGGMFIWVTLPEGIDGTALLARSVETERVAFVPGQAFHADRSGANTIRLSFSLATEVHADEGIRRLGALIERVIAEQKAA